MLHRSPEKWNKDNKQGGTSPNSFNGAHIYEDEES